MKKTYIIALSLLLVLTTGVAVNDYAKQYQLILAEGSNNPGHSMDQIDGLQSSIDDINEAILGLGAASGGGSGDVNGDGDVNIFDAKDVAWYLEGSESFTFEQKLAADYDGDGIITFMDASAIAYFDEGMTREEAIRRAYSTVGIQQDGSYKIDHNTNINGNLYVSGGIRNEGGSGDANGDGSTTAVDATRILRYLDGLETFTPEQRLAADYDGDGLITFLDARAILISRGYPSLTKEQVIAKAHSSIKVDGNGVYQIGHNTNINGSLYISGGIRAEGGSGDVNGGGLSVTDARDIAWYVNGSIPFTSEQELAADYDGDGIITYRDSKAVAWTVVGYTKEDAIRKAQNGVFVSGFDEDCESLTEGYQRYNSSTKKMEYCNGSSWTVL